MRTTETNEEEFLAFASPTFGGIPPIRRGLIDPLNSALFGVTVFL